MSEKLPYADAMIGVCALNGWIARFGQPTVRNGDGKTIVTVGNLTLITQDDDIRSAWDPMDYDRQIQARDKLASALKGLATDFMSVLIEPAMWRVA